VFAVAATLLASVFSATLTAPTHTPKVGTRWPYEVRVTESGTPVAARITVQIVDPLGGLHPVTYGTTRRRIVNWPIRGVFRDFVVWPRDARGFTLRLRVTVVRPDGRRVLAYRVTPR
jgi:hypothetical protein